MKVKVGLTSKNKKEEDKTASLLYAKGDTLQPRVRCDVFVNVMGVVGGPGAHPDLQFSSIWGHGFGEQFIC